jgi:hypothetical protein
MKNTITKSTIYTTIKSYVSEHSADFSEEMYEAIIDRMGKDIELASKKSSGTSKAQQEKDAFNKDIQTAILNTLADKGTMIYADLIKAVQGTFSDVELSPQKITANVTKLKGEVEKFEDGKGKSKKLYIKLA